MTDTAFTSCFASQSPRSTGPTSPTRPGFGCARADVVPRRGGGATAGSSEPCSLGPAWSAGRPDSGRSAIGRAGPAPTAVHPTGRPYVPEHAPDAHYAGVLGGGADLARRRGCRPTRPAPGAHRRRTPRPPDLATHPVRIAVAAFAVFDDRG